MNDTILHEEQVEQEEKIDVPIRCYMHITMINDFIDITEYILDKATDSGLLESCEGVFIGALGDESELPKLKKLISKYHKTKIIDHHSEKGRWEFHTIQHLKRDADTLPQFYAWYFHSKSVTYPPNGDGINKTVEHKQYEVFWRDMMTHEVITRWRDCYNALSLPEYGYDIAGCRMIPKRKSGSIFSHASGNFIACNSEYIKTLPKIGQNDDVSDIGNRLIELRNEIDELQKTGELKILGNVFYPEMYWWQQQPLTYISCNALTDGFPYWDGTFEEWSKKVNLDKYRTNP